MSDPTWFRIVLAVTMMFFYLGVVLIVAAPLVAYEMALAYFLGKWWTFGLGLCLPFALIFFAICYQEVKR